MEVQKYLRQFSDWEEALDALCLEYNILYNAHGSEPLVILNYHQLESPKHHRITAECRGLVLDRSNNWEVVAKPFDRFFNFGESRYIAEAFNWEDFTVRTKEDGTLFIVYYYNGKWRVNTRNSFGTDIVGESGKTWSQWFHSLIGESPENWPTSWQSFTFTFEFCSIWNQVVRLYEEPTLYLLEVVNNKTLEELSLKNKRVLVIASLLKVKLPEVHEFLDVDHANYFIAAKGDSSFEGFVFQDSNGLRFKLKNPDYVARHRLLGNNGASLTCIRNLVPLLLKGEADEIKLYCQKLLIPRIEEVERCLAKILEEATAVYSNISHLTDQKEFAIKAKASTRYSSLLFTARKKNVSVKDVFLESEDYLIKILEKEMK